ncbi:MAG TPA: DUF1775 domain-containing protein [Gaiellaceae bacterium]|jgi:uncharacterized protein YcnI|nr:DUF1775 domain-containing protein [Gaiellaceae bacterium]
MRGVRKRIVVFSGAVLAALLLAATASAHAIMSPAVVKAENTLQQFTLSVPTEESGAVTTKIVLTVPSQFAIDSFEPPTAPWKMVTKSTGSGDSEVFQQVTWTGGHTPTGFDSVFRFNGSIAKPGTVTFQVTQYYSNGKVVEWNQPSEASDTPAPRVEAVSSFGGGGGTSTLEIVALVLAIAALVIAVIGLLGSGGKGKRELA